MKLTHDEIVQRLAIGAKTMEQFAKVDRNQSRKFRDPKASDILDLDPALTTLESNDDQPTDITEGVVNQQAANIITKIAVIGVGEPAVAVSMDESAPEESGRLIQRYWQHIWRTNNMRRVAAHVLMKRCLCGLGVSFYRWDAKRAFVLEPAHSWDIGVDPFVTDWKRPSWMWRRIRMSRRSAEALYGKAAFQGLSDADATGVDSTDVKLQLYWDEDTEAHIYEDRVLNTRGLPNLYGRVPIAVMQGDPDPNPTPFPLGDVQMSAGLQAALTELWQCLYSTALNGGPINVVDESMVKGSIEEAWQKGRRSGVIPVKTNAGDVVKRYPGEVVSPAMLPATQTFMSGMDALMGIGQYDRGVIDNPARFATEAMMIQQRAGARSVQNRIDYEDWLHDVASALIENTAKFGGPLEGQERPPEVDLLWEACLQVRDIRIVASSTMYKDPTAEQQPMMALLQQMSQAAPIFAQLGMPVPNLKAIGDDVLRAFGRTDVEKYWIVPAQQTQEGVPDV